MCLVLKFKFEKILKKIQEKNEEKFLKILRYLKEVKFQWKFFFNREKLMRILRNEGNIFVFSIFCPQPSKKSQARKKIPLFPLSVGLLLTDNTLLTLVSILSKYAIMFFFFFFVTGESVKWFLPSEKFCRCVK